MDGRRAPGARRPPPRSRHFLRTRELAAELVRDADVRPDDLVLDLGAGSGRLTEPLARAAGRVLAVEIDPRLAGRLRGRWSNVTVVEADAAVLGLPEEPFRVVANLPFHRTTDFLHLLLDDPRTPLERADLVVQWEVAVRRSLPWPSSVNGVCWSAFYEWSVSRRLPCAAFVPPPDVDAGVLVVRRRPEPLVPLDAVDEYRRFVSSGFRHGLRRVAGRRALSTVARERRIPRDLDAHEWAALFAVTRGVRASAHGAGAERSTVGASVVRPRGGDHERPT